MNSEQIKEVIKEIDTQLAEIKAKISEPQGNDDFNTLVEEQRRLTTERVKLEQLAPEDDFVKALGVEVETDTHEDDFIAELNKKVVR